MGTGRKTLPTPPPLEIPPRWPVVPPAPDATAVVEVDEAEVIRPGPPPPPTPLPKEAIKETGRNPVGPEEVPPPAPPGAGLTEGGPPMALAIMDG